LWTPLHPNITGDENNEIQRVAQSEETQNSILKHYEMNDQDFQSAIIRQKRKTKTQTQNKHKHKHKHKQT